MNARASREVESELRRGVTEAGILVDDNRTTVSDSFMRLARLVADLPKLKAAVATEDPPTVQPLADEYRMEMRADLLVLTGRAGHLLAASGPGAASLASAHPAAAVDEISTFALHEGGLLQLVSVPVYIEGEPADLLGRLTAGFFLDDDIAAQLKRLTGSEIAFAVDGQVRASTLPHSADAQLNALLAEPAITAASIGGEDFIGAVHPLPLAAAPASPVAPTVLILSSRTERLRFLDTLRNGLLAALLAAFLLSTLVSYGVARTVARPLNAITAAMHDVAATGDLTRKVVLRSGRWDDADARVLATAFNTLTESIARFQREATQKDRLLSLGRLSTVIAHEVRNPLMIIKASLRSLGARGALDADEREAVRDIEEETTRLNRIVADVLDFAKPIHFELAETSLNEVCRASAAAVWADAGSDPPVLDLDPSMPAMPLDADRLRTALVNLLANARHALPDGRSLPNGVVLRTTYDGGTATVTIADRGVGIALEDMPHIFDPYFTTRRGGTGLGLPIAKNIVEGMGGTLSVSSEPGQGTCIQVQLPARPSPPTVAQQRPA